MRQFVAVGGELIFMFSWRVEHDGDMCRRPEGHLLAKFLSVYPKVLKGLLHCQALVPLQPVLFGE